MRCFYDCLIVRSSSLFLLIIELFELIQNSLVYGSLAELVQLDVFLLLDEVLLH